MTRHDNDLLDAVDALTKPVRRKVIQEVINGTEPTGTKTVTIEDPPLLEQLEEAIRGTVGFGGAGAGPSERNMLNNDALFKSVLITNQIKDWARIAGIATRPKDEPISLLRRWFVLYGQTPHSDELTNSYVAKMTGWATMILGMFDPPRTMDLPDPCPTCGAKTWWKDGLEFARPLILTFHDGPRMIEDGKGMCRACETTFGLRELSYATEAQNAA